MTSKQTKWIVYCLILVLGIAAANAITLDELLAGYDWSYDNGDIDVTGYSSYGLDTGGSAMYDLVVVNMTVDAAYAGTYTFSGGLKDPAGDDAATAELTTALGAGVSNVLMNFPAEQLEDGVYNFSVRVNEDGIIFEDYDAHQVTIDTNYEDYPVDVAGMADMGASTDADGEYERLDISITVNVSRAGEYEFTGFISDMDSRTVRASKKHNLTTGVSIIDLPFDSRAIRTGHLGDNFSLMLLEIKNISQDFSKKITSPYDMYYDTASFDPEGVLVTGSFSDEGIDTNSNTYYDKVQLDVSVYSDQSRSVEVEGAITDSYGNFVQEFNKTASLNAGSNTVSFELNGTGIYNTGINGPYRIGYVNVIDGNDTLDSVKDAATLQNITYYTHCEAPAKADFVIDTSDIQIEDLGNGLHNIEVTARNIGDRTAFAAQVNVFDNSSDELGESTLYFIQKGSEKTITFPRLDLSDSDTISVFLDFNDLVEEKNESNNVVKINTTIGLTLTNTTATEGDAPFNAGFSSSISKGNGGIAYLWSFGDGAASALQNPTHEYTTPGNYTAVLTVTDATGLSASGQVNIKVMTPPDTTPPAGVSGLGETTVTNESIRWEWTNPADSDFSHVMVYLDGVFQSNTSNNFFNKIGLQANTTYTISTRTADNNGNINTTWVSDTAETSENLEDTTPPGPITGLLMAFRDDTSIYWIWTDPSDGDFSHSIVYLNGVFQTNTTTGDFYPSGLTPGTQYTISIMTADNNGNINTQAVNDTTSTTGTVPDTTPPAAVSGLADQDEGDTWIYWTWTDPSDPDFSHSIIYIDNVWKANTSDQYYNATGLSSGTSYEIEIETVDTNDNINTNRKTDSASTTTPGDTTPPGPVSSLGETAVTNESIRWEWTNPADSDFSHVIVVIGGVNAANTSNTYYEATGLSADTSYTISLQTADSTGNINTNSVQDSARTNANVQPVSDPVYADAGYPLFGIVGDTMQFDGSYSYAEKGISSYSWNFGDSSTASSASPTHAYSSTGSYTATLTVVSNGGNSSVDSVKVVITGNPGYNYVSYVGDFSVSNAQLDMTVREYGEDNVNGFRKADDYTIVEAVLKIEGDSIITKEQVQMYSAESESCVPVGNSYFKCVLFDSGQSTENVNTYDLPVEVYDDGAVEIGTVSSYIIVDGKKPTVNSLDAASSLTNDPSITFNYDISDYAYLTTDGSGIGKIELYDGSVSAANYIMTEKVDSASADAAGSFSYSSGVGDGASESLSFCAVVYDKLRQSTEVCGIDVVIDREDPAVVGSSLKLLDGGSEITEAYDGDKLDITIQITEENGLDASSVSADLSELNSIYGDVAADSCSASGSTWTCVWNDKELDISADKTISIDISFSDDAGNSNSATEQKHVAIGNRDPALSVSDMTIDEGDTITIDPTVSDPDGDSVSVSYSGWMSSESYTADYSDSGSHTVTVTANDGNGGIVSEEITIKVNDVAVADLHIEEANVWDGGNPVVAEFIVKNIGEAGASGIRWSIDSKNAQKGTSGGPFSLGVGEDVVIYSFVTYSKAGTYDFTINLDPNESIAELDEGNNDYSHKVVVS